MLGLDQNSKYAGYFKNALTDYSSILDTDNMGENSLWDVTEEYTKGFLVCRDLIS